MCIRDRRENELIAGIRSDAAAQIYGPDLDRLRAAGDQIASILKRVPGAVDVRPEQTAGLTYLRIKPDRARLARYGPVSYTHLRAHETPEHLVCRLLLE